MIKHNIVDIEGIKKLLVRAEDIIFDESLVSDVQLKGRADYVTKVDIGVQSFIINNLKGMYPNVDFIAEENGLQECDPEKTYWILDPIDGTTNLLHHYLTSAISLAYFEGGRVTFGVVYNPFRKEMFMAVEGQGAYLNDQRIHVTDIADIKDALVSFGATPYRKEMAPYLFKVYEKIYQASADYRRCGSAALDMCHVACGRIDAFVEMDLKPWDFAAGYLIVHEAGGKVESWYRDEKFELLKPGNVFAENGLVGEAIHDIIDKIERPFL